MKCPDQAAAQVPESARTGSKPYPPTTPDAAAPKAFDDFGEGPPYHMGTASPMHHDDEPYDVVRELHKVVEEVTGKPVDAPKQRIGFL